MPDPGTDLLISVGGVAVGALTTWATIARGYGALQERVANLSTRIDRHEERVTSQLDVIEKKMDRVLDESGAGRSGSRAFPRAGE